MQPLNLISEILQQPHVKLRLRHLAARLQRIRIRADVKGYFEHQTTLFGLAKCSPDEGFAHNHEHEHYDRVVCIRAYTNRKGAHRNLERSVMNLVAWKHDHKLCLRKLQNP